MEQTSLTVGRFTQLAVARSLMALPSHIEKELLARDPMEFSRALLRKIFNPETHER